MCYFGPCAEETRPADRDVSSGHQSRHVGGEHVGKVEGRKPPDSTAFLWAVGVDHHYTRINAACNFLQIPLDCLLMRNMEKGLQD